MKKINLGLIGLGYIGKFHLINSLKIKDARVVAVADNSKKALNFAKNLGVKHLFLDYSELLEQADIDAVIISLPTHLHASCAIRAAEKGKHILLEKPIARNPDEAKQIISMAEKHDVVLMVGYPMKFHSTFENLKKVIESGELGEIQAANAVMLGSGPFLHRAEGTTPQPVPEWWFNKELTGGGALIDLGSHMINLTRWYFGEVRDVKAFLGHRFNFDFEDYAICVASYDCGATATINVGWFSQKPLRGIEVYGTVAHAQAYYSSPNKVITAIQLIMKRTPKFFVPYLKEVIHFIKCIKEGLQPLNSGEDALKDLEVIAQAYKNAKNI